MSSSPVTRVGDALDRTRANGQFHAVCMAPVVLLDATAKQPGDDANAAAAVATATFKMLIAPELGNAYGTMHGGAVATVLDVLTSITIAATVHPGWTDAHVSRSLSCTFLRPLSVGAEARIECEVVAIGRRTVLCRGVMRDGTTNAICYTCEHDKINVTDSSRK